MQHSDTWWRTFNTKPMADRQIDQLIGLAQGIVADGIVNQAEAETLQNWLRANQTTTTLTSAGCSTKWSECSRTVSLTKTKAGSCTTRS